MLRPASPSPARVRRRVAALLLALGPLAPLALLGACEDLGPDRSRLVVRFDERQPLGRERLVVTVRDGRRQYYVEGLDFARGADGWWQARELRLATDGQAEILVALRGAGTSPAAAGELTLPLTPNARWRLDVFASSAEQAVACGDCTGVQRFGIVPALRPSAQDWLYVTWTLDAP